MKTFLRKYSPAIILFIVSFLAYGLMIPWLGFYWDDWPMAWFANTLGPLGFKDALAIDRPFLTGIYILTTSILPIKPIYWQIFALISRWACGISVYWAMTKIWPDAKKQMLWVSILFTVFPGFKQQPISIIYGNGFILLTSFFLSLGLMVNALEQVGRKKALTIGLSIFLQIFTIFSTEYYAGLELLRILIIWYKKSLNFREFKAWFKIMFVEYLPYGIGLLTFFIWRVFIFKFPTYKPVSMQEFSNNQYPEILVFLNRMIQDIYLTIWKAWAEIFHFPDLVNIAGSSEFFYWAAVFLLIPITFLFLRKYQKENHPSNNNAVPFAKYQNQILIVAIASILLGAMPFWATNLPIQLVYPYDRFFLSLMFGSSLLVVYLIEKFLQGETIKFIAIALLISFSIGAQINNTNTYRREWNVHNEFFWQLSWRVPALQENTLLLAETFPLEYYSDNSLTAPLNWIYDPSDTHIPLKYMMFFTDIRLGSSLPALKPKTVIKKQYRSTHFEGSTDQLVGFFYTTDACLHILDPQLSRFDPLLPESIYKITKLSDPDRILPAQEDNPLTLDQSIFGKEPAHGWCYYYEKADLARQYQDWATVLQLEQSTVDQSLQAMAASEYLPFSEAFAATGDWKNALKYIRKAYAMDKSFEKGLCRELQRYQKKYVKTRAHTVLLAKEMKDLGCP